MRKTYLAAVSGTEGNFGIVFRDFPGCVSSGDTLEEVLSMGAEALQGHVELLVEGGDSVPEPSDHSLEAVDAWLDLDQEERDRNRWVGMYPIEIEIPAYPRQRLKKSA